MAIEEQVEILKKGVAVWNKWRKENPDVGIDLSGAQLSRANLQGADLQRANLSEATLNWADLNYANLIYANLSKTNSFFANFFSADLHQANLRRAHITGAVFNGADLTNSNLLNAEVGFTIFGRLDLSKTRGLYRITHRAPSVISTNTFALSMGKIPEVFLRGCGLMDWEIASAKLYDPELDNEAINRILYKMYDLRASQAVQISPLFISYSHGDSAFVDKLEYLLFEKGIRFWRDVHDLKSGRIEKQIDRAIRQNPTVILILSKHSLKSDWVEHEVREARGLEKELGRDVLCPITLDAGWKTSRWPKRIMEQVTEYNVLDFSAWKDDSKFESAFNKLIDGLNLFYK